MRMTKDDFAKAQSLLKTAGLIMPPVPQELKPRLRERTEWCYSTRVLKVWPYNINEYVNEALNGRPRNYLVLAHAGHGVNSYAMHYFLVRRTLQLFLQVGWGGVYMNAREATTQVNECFRLAGRLLAAVEEAVQSSRLRPADRLTVVATDFYGGFWLPPEKEARGRRLASM